MDNNSKPILLINSDVGAFLDNASDSMMDDEIDGVIEYLDELLEARWLRYKKAGRPFAASDLDAARHALKRSRASVSSEVDTARRSAACQRYVADEVA